MTHPAAPRVAPTYTADRLAYHDPWPDPDRLPIGALVHAMGEYIRNRNEHHGPVGDIPARDWLAAQRLSAHAAIHPDGTLVNWVPETRAARHAGVSRWGTFTGLNKYMLGAEWLVPGAHTYSTFVDALTDPTTFAVAQYNAGGWLYAYWARLCDFDVAQVMGHDVVAGDAVRGPGKGKRDPGSGFRWSLFREAFRDWYATMHGTHGVNDDAEN